MASRQGGGQQYRVHTARAILSAFAGALLASTPRSDALLALPAALPPASAARGQGARQRGTGPAAPAAAAPTAFGMQRRPSSPSSSTSAPACAPASGSRSSIGRSRRHRASLLVMSGLGAGDEGAGGGGGAEGGEVVGDAAEREGAAVEGQGGVMMGRPPAGSASEEGEDEKQEGGVAAKSSSAAGEATTVGSSATAAASAATTGTRVKKKKKKAAKRAKRGAPGLKGEALRDQLMRREKREEERVLAVNTLFYRSRAYNEIEDLMRVWDKSELSECIRSIGGTLRGYDNIIEEYKTDFLLAQKQEKPGLRPFKVKNLKVQTCGTLAWVTCIEDMRSPYKPYPKTVQLVTNVFRKTSSGWRLVRHHASDRDVAVTKSAGGKQILKPSRELPGGGSSLLHNFVDKTGGVTELSARLFRVVNGEMRPFDLDFNPSDSAMGDDDDDDDDDDNDEVEEDITDQIGREIASQIFLNYGDLFEDGNEIGEGTIEIPLGDINFSSSSGKSSGGGGGGSSESLDETIPPAMRKRIEEAELEAKLKEKSSEANERFKNIYNLSEGLKEVTQDSSSSSSSESDAATRDDDEWGDIGGGGKRWSISGGRGSSGERDGGAGREYGEGKEVEDAIAARESRDLTRKTVDAVRVLAEMGRINARQKGLLLADVIRNASSAGSSRAEVAYSLLLDGDVTPEGMEYTEKADEFADQLKAITVQLEEQQNSNGRRWWKFWAKPQWWKFWTRQE